jgi:small-conductance mechanosensitive channel
MSASVWNAIGRIAVTLLLGVVGVILLQLGLRGVVKGLKKSGEGGERLERLVTLIHVLRSIGQVVVVLIVLLMVLHQLGINITPFLASAGVVGLAFSLGAQTIIKDYLGGILILAENQFAIGDVVSVGQVTGSVERLTLRATYLRDSEGKLNLIPNGDIRTVSNLTVQWAQVVVTLTIDYEADMGRALKSLEQAVQSLQSDEEVAAALLDSPKIFGWAGFTDWGVNMQIIAKTGPGKQWQVGRSLRKAALEQLDKDGIRIAIPRQRIENIS